MADVIESKATGDVIESKKDTSSATDVDEEGKKANSLGIPAAQFVEDVDEFMARSENDSNATNVLKRFDEAHTKYRFMEQNLLQKKKRLKKQIPEIESSIDVLKMVKARRDAKEEVVTQFLLSDQVYMKAKIPPTDSVCLWLGANVMLEYPIPEAEQLLTKNMNTAKANLEQIETDLDFLRDQITTSEVNMARVYNWDVKRRASEKNKDSEKDKDKAIKAS